MVAVVISAVLVWSASLQMKLMSDNAKSSQLANSLGSKTNEYTQILGNERKLVDAKNKLKRCTPGLGAFPAGGTADALQHSTMEGIQITRVRLDQNFRRDAGGQVENGGRRADPGKAGASVERITLSSRPRTATPIRERSHDQFKEVIARNPFFQGRNITTNSILLREISSPQVDTESGGTLSSSI